MRCDQPAAADRTPPHCASAASPLPPTARDVAYARSPRLLMQGIPTGSQETVAISSSLSLIKARLRSGTTGCPLLAGLLHLVLVDVGSPSCRPWNLPACCMGVLVLAQLCIIAALPRQGVVSNAQAASLLSDDRVASNDLIAGGCTWPGGRRLRGPFRSPRQWCCCAPCRYPCALVRAQGCAGRGGAQGGPPRHISRPSSFLAGVYEGGFKTWEGGIDLAQYLANVLLGSGSQRGQGEEQQQGQPPGGDTQEQQERQQQRWQQDQDGRGGGVAPALTLGPGSRVMELVSAVQHARVCATLSGSDGLRWPPV